MSYFKFNVNYLLYANVQIGLICFDEINKEKGDRLSKRESEREIVRVEIKIINLSQQSIK